MAVSVRSVLMSGVSVIGATAIAVAPVHAPPPETTAHTAGPVRAVSDQFVQLLAAAQPVPAPTEPVALSAASDAILEAWYRALPWLDYWVDLAAYLVDFIPFGFGFEIADQIYMVYYTLTRPIANSFVVDLVAPVVNDPFNLDTWITGVQSVTSTTVMSVRDFAVAEFWYFFGWLIPPLPPIPPLQTAVEAPATEAMAQTAAATEDETTVSEGTAGTDTTEETAVEGTDTTEETEETTETVEGEETPELDETDETDELAEIEPTTSTTGTVAAQGEVRGSDVDATDDEATDDTDDTSVGDNGAEAGGAAGDTPSDDADAGDTGDGGDGGQA
ncbi:hypothetical protein H7I53_13040 [Mycolicibacterium pulveris]|uniref:PE family protein n=1 Tax=Mycolicibacterium pulveris TaxID=36813 RepID=A0A7I7UM07_MYCPV|nr:hypothetical protein [Mycolicibacterium pulveris]MCV6981147.1 hypothetical protein [Mycolicibacterium pulveris]BBY82415.1 hypothetical protein MPUL_35730 [Mycolicibacterium pulveris]